MPWWQVRSRRVRDRMGPVAAIRQAHRTQEPEVTGKLFYSVREACVALGIGRSFLYELLARNELPSVVLGRRRLIPVAALEQWAAQQAGIEIDSGIPVP